MRDENNNQDIQNAQHKENVEFYNQFLGKCSENIKSNVLQFDKSILTLSSAALGLSFILIGKSVFPVGEVIVRNFLICSWVLFAVAIAFTVLSYFFANKGITRSCNYAEKYYLKGEKKYRNKKSIHDKIAGFLTWTSGFIFLAAVGFLLCFAIINFNHKTEVAMSKDKSNKINEHALKAPVMKVVPGEKKGLGAPIMQVTPDTSTQDSDSNSNSGTTDNSSSGEKD